MHATASLLHRGVFLAPFLSASGLFVLLAIDSCGRCVRRRPVREARLEQARNELVALLDLLDPQSRPQTRLAEPA